MIIHVISKSLSQSKERFRVSGSSCGALSLKLMKIANMGTRERELRSMAETVMSININKTSILSDENENDLEVGDASVEVHSPSE